MPLPGLTLLSLQAQLAATHAARRVWRQKLTAARRATARLAAAVLAVDREAKDWYAAATAVYEADSTEGTVLRSTIPTTYVKRYAEAAKKRRAAKRAAAATAPQ